jgi:phosphohistidine swiveling domain-containing protein
MKKVASKFIKMWGAHAMPASAGEQVNAYNFSHDKNLKKHCGLVEKETVFFLKKGVGSQFYYAIKDLDKAATFGFNRFTDKKKTEQYLADAQKAVSLSDESYSDFLVTNLKSKTLQELLPFYIEKLKVYEASYSIYHACQPQYVKKIEQYVQEKLNKDFGLGAANEIYSTLTLSSEHDPLALEELGWLEIVKDIKRQCPNIKRLSKVCRTQIEEYSKKYIYLGLVEANTPWDFNYYFKRLEKDIKKDHQKEIDDLNSKKTKLVEKKRQLIKKYNLSKEIQVVCNNLAEIGLIRLVIRFAWTKAAYVSNSVLEEIVGKITDPELGQGAIYQYRLAEMINALERKVFLSPEEIEKRKSAYMYFSEDSVNDYGDKVHFYSGDDAIKKKKEIIQEESLDAKEIKGIVACKGSATGRVVMFTWIEEDLAKKMEEMKEGDILVAGQTRPFLMPAIRKAGAIITDEGGITCHAAIVSRELNIPCIIGTKIGTKILKDGDLVEVNAEKGIVKIL